MVATWGAEESDNEVDETTFMKISEFGLENE